MIKKTLATGLLLSAILFQGTAMACIDRSSGTWQSCLCPSGQVWDPYEEVCTKR